MFLTQTRMHLTGFLIISREMQIMLKFLSRTAVSYISSLVSRLRSSKLKKSAKAATELIMN